VLQKGVAVARQPIPLGGVDVGDALGDPEFDDGGRLAARARSATVMRR
jgi:hypothetical protein